MRITFVSFQGFNKNGVPEGMVRILYPILKNFNDYIYYIGYGLKNDNKKIKKISNIYYFLKKLTLISCKILHINYGISRHIQEYLFDLFLLLKITEPTILFTTAYIPKSAKRNHKLGGINIFLAGNPRDRFIHNVLKKQEECFKIKILDAYTNDNRLKFIDRFIKQQDHIICQTLVTYDSYLNKYEKSFLSLNEVHIIPSKKVFIKKEFINEDKTRFVYLAHTVILKGLVYLIDAWNKLDTNSAILIIGGNIPINIYSEISKYQNKNIQFIGPININEINEFYRKSDVCIVPSLIDDHPATITEALYCGLPVITTQGCGSKTLIEDGKNGFVVPVADSNAIAEKIQWFIDNKHEIPRMSKYAVDSISNIDNSNQDEEFTKHILEIIDKLKLEKGIL